VGSLVASSAEWTRRNPFFAYDPMRSILPFHASAHPRRMVRAPNQTTKTFSAAWEAWAHLIGAHRWRPEIRPSPGWVMLADLENGYPTIAKKLRAVEPGDWLDPATHYIEGKGYYTNGRRMIRSKLGHLMEFRSGEGEMMALAMASIGWLWIDEVPKQSHFGEALSRVAVAKGPAWMSFTPIGRPAGWLRRHVEGDPDTGDPPREDWQQIRIQLTERDCTTETGRVIRTEDSIERQCAAYSHWELAQRRYGEWEGVSTDRRLKGFSEACLLTLDELPTRINPKAGDEIRVSMDHGEGTGKQVAYLEVLTGRKTYLYREWVARENSGPREVATGILAMLADAGLSIYDVSKIVGDINSAGLAAGKGGGKYNDFIERELCTLLNVATSPVEITTPNKRPGTVDAGESAMSHAMKEGRFFVFYEDGHPFSCKAFVGSARHYTGREKDLKDPIDAARYGCQDRLLQPVQSPGRVVLTI
jgi:hypothetical protein